MINTKIDGLNSAITGQIGLEKGLMGIISKVSDTKIMVLLGICASHVKKVS